VIGSAKRCLEGLGVVGSCWKKKNGGNGVGMVEPFYVLSIVALETCK
jgi:hypothetical protein